jgi:hypothetical protein
MKKITILSAISLAVFATSCQKEGVRQPGSNVAAGNPTVATISKQTIISSWFILSLSLASDRNEIYLTGTEPFGRYVDYDKTQHVELAYVMMPGERFPVVKRLPMKLKADNGSQTAIFDVQFSLDNTGFILTVKNTDPGSIAADATLFQDFRYRYIVIPKETYDSFQIDWDNYNEVTQALNL